MDRQERAAFIDLRIREKLFFYAGEDPRNGSNPLAFLLQEAAAQAYGDRRFEVNDCDMGQILRSLDAELKDLTGEPIGPDDLVHCDADGKNVISRNLLNEEMIYFINAFLSHGRPRFTMSHCLAEVKQQDGRSVPLGLLLIANGVGSHGMLDEENPLWLYFGVNNLEASATDDLVEFRRLVQERADKYNAALDRSAAEALRSILGRIRTVAPELLDTKAATGDYPPGLVTEAFRQASGIWQDRHPQVATHNGNLKLFTHALALLDRDPRLHPQPEAAPEPASA